MAMRIFTGILCTAALLFTAAAVGLLGTWALALATVLGMVGTLGVVTVLEGRDVANPIAAPVDRRPSHLRVAGLVAVNDDLEAA